MRLRIYTYQIKRAFVSILVVIFTIFVILWIVDLFFVWNIKDSWGISTITNFPKDLSNLKITKEVKDAPDGTKTFNFSIDYAVLTNIKENNDTYTYYFTLTPYLVLKRNVKNFNELKSIPNQLSFSIKKDTKPEDFLGRRLFSSASYSTLPNEVMQRGALIPVKLRIEYQYKAINKNNIIDIFKHWKKYRLEKKVDYLPANVTKWSITKLPEPSAYFENKESLDKYIINWTNKTLEYYKQSCFGNWDNVGSISSRDLFKNFKINCGYVYQNCSVEGCNGEKRTIHPATTFSYLLYSFYNLEPDAFNKLFLKFKDYYEKHLNECSEESDWCSLWISTFSVYPVRNMSLGKQESGLDGTRLASLKTLFEQVFSLYYTQPGEGFKVGTPKDNTLWWFVPAMQNYGAYELQVLNGKFKPDALADTDFYFLLLQRLSDFRQGNEKLRKTVLYYPLNQEDVAKYLYMNMVLSPYKDTRLFRVDDMKVSLQDSKCLNQKDNLMTLIWLYEYGKVSK